jgi:hypothetical protein
MSCDEAKAQLNEYLDQRLPERERLLVADHLDTCPACRERCQELQRLRGLLRESPELTPPESFCEGVRARIAERSGQRRGFAWGVFPKALVTTCALVLMVVVTREVRRSEPELFRQAWVSSKKVPVSVAAPVSRPAPQPGAGPVMPTMKGNVSLPQPFATGPAAREAEQRAGSLNDLIHQVESQPGFGGPTGSGALAEIHPPILNRGRAASAQAAAPVAPMLQSVRAKVAAPAAPEPSDAASLSLAGTGAVGALHATAAPAMNRPSQPNAQALVVQNEEAWRTLWYLRQNIAGSSGNLPPPKVDFSQYVVAAVLDSRIPPNDLSIEIEDIQTSPDQVEVDYRVHSPGDYTTSTGQTEPFHFRVLPKTNLPIRFKQIP